MTGTPPCCCKSSTTYMQVLPLYWPYERSLQSKVLQSLQSAEHGLGRDNFRAHNLRVTNQTESDGHVIVSLQTSLLFADCTLLQGDHSNVLPVAVSVQGITKVGILEFNRVEGPAELQIAKYCMSKMKELRSSSSLLYLRSFMPMATCEVVGSELQ